MFVVRLLYIVGVCDDFLSTNFQPGFLEGFTFHTCKDLLAKVQVASGKLIERYTQTQSEFKDPYMRSACWCSWRICFAHWAYLHLHLFLSSCL